MKTPILSCLLEEKLAVMDDILSRAQGHGAKVYAEDLSRHLRLALAIIRELQEITTKRVY